MSGQMEWPGSHLTDTVVHQKILKSRLFKVGIILLRFDFFDICSSDHKANRGGVQFHEPAVKTLNLRSNWPTYISAPLFS